LKAAAEDWNSFKTAQLPQFNQQLRQANLNTIPIAGNNQ